MRALTTDDVRKAVEQAFAPDVTITLNAGGQIVNRKWHTWSGECWVKYTMGITNIDEAMIDASMSGIEATIETIEQ